MNKLLTGNKVFINLVTTVLVFLIGFLINFLLAPFVVKYLGVEANGFLQLANTFVSYLGIISIAVNSMSSRFITFSLEKKNYVEAGEYYSSTFLGNLIIIAVITVPIVLGILNIDRFISVPASSVEAVEWLFLLMYVSYLISIITPNWNIAFFATNKIYLQTVGNMLSAISRALVIILMFAMMKPSVWYVGVAAVVASFVAQAWQYACKTREPNINQLLVKWSYVKWERLKILLTSGIWNSINQLGVMLISGLDLLLADIYISGEIMGMVAIAQTIPNFLISFQSSVTYTFAPQMTILYSNGKIAELVHELKQAGRILIVIIGIPFAAIILFGAEFYRLWLPSQDSGVLQEITILYTVGYSLLAGIMPLWNIFAIVNKTKPNAYSVLISGGLSLLVTVLALRYTNMGIVAIAMIGSIFNILRNVIFTLPFSAKYLSVKWYTFFPLIGYTAFSFFLEFLIGKGLLLLIDVNSWMKLGAIIIVFSLLSFVMIALTILNHQEREIIINFINPRR
ncbi:hypothetical protein ESZ50_01770 [Weissella muntiaci]|uniref:Polysaccharide biosynthesis protein n=1 Tax=Weissella muntiaci TaxID=2508881 RepID=A0A6C2C9H3_9LACO|nr:hypothetical protein [Weissella muntiaci]TYC50690.1 hypothetical protein ESZ50_01770 [Weissella muntiaci]